MTYTYMFLSLLVLKLSISRALLASATVLAPLTQLVLVCWVCSCVLNLNAEFKLGDLWLQFYIIWGRKYTEILCKVMYLNILV